MPEVIEWLMFQLLCRNRVSAAPCAAMSGGWRSSLWLLCSAVLELTPRSAPSKMPTIPGDLLSRPLGFRATCYYYRKAYYRAFFLDPPACAVGESPRRNYRGETAFPFILQNVHRYFFYLAVLFIAFLWHDAISSFFFDGRFGVGVGTLVLTLNVSLLSLYTFSCHSLRHLAGGKLDCFSCANFGRSRFAAWRVSTFLNERHMLFAWCSLVSVGFADFYVRMVACGAIRDLRLL